jgi:hypothetical protein
MVDNISNYKTKNSAGEPETITIDNNNTSQSPLEIMVNKK